MNFPQGPFLALRHFILNPANVDGFDSSLLSSSMVWLSAQVQGLPEQARTELKHQKPSSGATTETTNQAENPAHSLNAKLSAYRRESGQRRPDFAKAYDALVERLDIIDRGEVGPQLGGLMPPFALPDESGQLVSLSSLLRSGPVVVSINRGHWCPYCKLDLRSLAEIHGDIRRLGARAISIMPDSAQFTAGYVAQNELPFPVLSDIDLGYSLSLGLIFWVGSEVEELYKRAGVELEKYHGNPASFLPMAAKFIVGHDGLVKARQVNLEFRERMEPDAIIAVLRELHAG
jgi:peroxiredoxin